MCPAVQTPAQNAAKVWSAVSSMTKPNSQQNMSRSRFLSILTIPAFAFAGAYDALTFLDFVLHMP